MDWTGYPINLSPEAEVTSTADLGAVLGRSGPFWDALVAALMTAEVGDEQQLAYAFPREHRAYGVWSGYDTPPTAAALVDALAAIPDAPPPPAGVELLPVGLTRLIANTLPTTDVSATLQYRELPTSPNVTRQWRTSGPATVEVDPRLLVGDPLPTAALTVRLTLPEASE